MNSRERVWDAIHHQQTDRPPLFATFVPEITARVRQHTGSSEFDLGVAMGNDMVKSCVGLVMAELWLDGFRVDREERLVGVENRLDAPLDKGGPAGEVVSQASWV